MVTQRHLKSIMGCLTKILFRCLWVTICTKVMLFPKCDFFGTPCIKVQIYLGLTCLLNHMTSSETSRFLGSGSTSFLGFGPTHFLGWWTGPGSASQPSSSEGVGVLSEELTSITNMGLEKTQFMVNMLNLPSAALVGTFWHSSFWTVSHCLSFTLEHSFLGTWRHSLSAFSFDSNCLSVSSTEKQKMINLLMLVVS